VVVAGFYFLQAEDALALIYPNGFDLSCMTASPILAVINESVDEWNSVVRQINPDSEINDFVGHDPDHVLKNMRSST